MKQQTLIFNMDARQEILNKIAYLINYEKDDVIAILNQNNIILVDGDVKTIANAIIDNIYTNTQLQADLDNLIDTKIK